MGEMKPKSIEDVINDLGKPMSIEDVLDEMVGANYMLTVAQISYIRAAHKNELNAVKAALETSVRDAFDAGRRHDGRALHDILEDGADIIDRIFRNGGVTE